MRKIGSIAFIFLMCQSAFAKDEIQFKATVSENRVALGDTVVLKVSLTTHEQKRAGSPSFEAPDFEIGNTSQSFSMRAQYDSSSGSMATVNTQEFSTALRPQKQGQLTIKNIQATVSGAVLTAPDVTVMVLPAGAQTGKSPREGDVTRGRMSRGQEQGTQAFLRVEPVGQQKVYFKGEQIILNYYLYHQMKIANLQVSRFPILNGFLREDIDMPVMNQRFETERVEVNKNPIYRTLLARYAAYPLQEGKLSLDPMSLKFNYFPRSRGDFFDDEDPFANFFQQLAPRIWSGQSEPKSIEVLPLPQDGKPEHFSGGIGVFRLTSEVDKKQVRAHEAVTLTVKITGKGNLSSVQAPYGVWPKDLELYDSKGQFQGNADGGGEKSFDFLLIPRTSGTMVLPSLEFSFFNVDQKRYETLKTNSFEIQVLEAAAGTQINPSKINESQNSNQNQNTPNHVKGVEIPTDASAKEFHSLSFAGNPLWRWLYWMSGVLFAFFVGVIGYDRFKKGKKTQKSLRKSDQVKRWALLEKQAQKVQLENQWPAVLRTYEDLSNELLIALEVEFKVSLRSFPRSEIQERLVTSAKLDSALWGRIVQLLDFSDWVRFASESISKEQALNELLPRVREGRSIVDAIWSRKV